ncbi:hypothetical protein PoB_002153600 [Plakobranchus ocellatus]|uniref:Uncharacterized protein n=1 Tax=Plakobranchus ocellatus TaxID=259542 RepID=A0AAV3Z6T9_9GAST|nr:hypothetical protein PoB_002153600 [Plakobranchus ocellatus]
MSVSSAEQTEQSPTFTDDIDGLAVEEVFDSLVECRDITSKAYGTVDAYGLAAERNRSYGNEMFAKDIAILLPRAR